MVVKVVKVGEQGSNGVIYGIPLATEMKELVKNVKEKCDAVQSAKRLTKGGEKKRNRVSFGSVQYKRVACRAIL